ncbi:uncharacterized protein LOC134835104 [Culicoides brevitarsis]|uniref:uncharacterized protein LOC134835104 n=1 Tax=Culicoides brevitarsis TaxID=469753 RepID=UPI00307B5C0A
MRLLISLWFLTICAALLIHEQQATTSPVASDEIFFHDDVDSAEELQTPRNCEDAINPELSARENVPVPIGSYNFEWAGFEHKNNRALEVNLQQLEKRSQHDQRGYLKHVHLYPPSCACQTQFRLFDLGHNTFPRFLAYAYCINREEDSRKCWLGSKCKEIPYIVRVLTKRENENVHDDEMANLLPHDLKSTWKFKNVKVSAACQCAL